MNQDDSVISFPCLEDVGNVKKLIQPAQGTVSVSSQYSSTFSCNLRYYVSASCLHRSRNRMELSH